MGGLLRGTVLELGRGWGSRLLVVVLAVADRAVWVGAEKVVAIATGETIEPDFRQTWDFDWWHFLWKYLLQCQQNSGWDLPVNWIWHAAHDGLELLWLDTRSLIVWLKLLTSKALLLASLRNRLLITF